MSNGLDLESFAKRSNLIDEKIKLLKEVENQLLEKKREERKQYLIQANQQLRNEVEQLKKQLITAERRNGVFQVPLPNQEAKSNVESTEAAQPQKAPVLNKEPASGGDNQPKASKKAAKKKPQNKKQAASSGDSPAVVDISRLDLRVGHIKEIGLHPDADGLYVEKIDVGEVEPRQVVTGVVKFIPIDQMENRKVVVLCNLKPSKLRGVTSQAMVMCASTPEKVEVIDPPTSAKPGDRISVPGFQGEPDGQINPKKKVLEKVLPDLGTDGSCVACYKGVAWQVNGENCKSQSLNNVKIK